MPASLPGATAVQNAANPSQGQPVIFDLMSGPKGSPFDRDAAGNASTGGLSTGLGFGTPPVLQSLAGTGIADDYTPGVTKPDGTAAPNATYMHIGGGRSLANGQSNPYTAGFGIGMAGNGGPRDAGAGPAFTGFPLKTVTAAGAVANGAVVETGFVNRSGQALATGQSVFGNSSTASAAVA